jgi:murein DD-endopeptidase MepM/ murein hydrolase activator NlpD
MKTNLHDLTQQWLITGSQPENSDLRTLQDHLSECSECQHLAGQIQSLAEQLPQQVRTPDFSASFLQRKSIQIQNESKRRNMKTFGLNVIRVAAWVAFGLLILAGALFVRDWLSPKQITQIPAAQPVQLIEPTTTPASAVEAPSASIPMKIDPALCHGPSLSPYMPGEDIAIDGGQVIIDNVTFEFWLTCSKTTENYSPGTNPIEGLGLHTFWIYNGPSSEILSDWYGFQPSIYQAIQDSPVSDASTTSSGASGTLSVAKADGQIPEGMFVLPNLNDPALFVTRLETTQGNYSAAVSFRLEAGPDGYRPMDVKIEKLPTTPPKYAFEKMKNYPSTAALEGPGACLLEEELSSSLGTGAFSWPIPKSYVDQEFPGVNLYSQDPNVPVTAADTGIVVFAGESSVGNNYAVVIEHGNGYQTVYFHLREVVVPCGSIAEKGQVIGETWNNAEGEAESYIHFQIYQDGVPINPLDVIQEKDDTVPPVISNYKFNLDPAINRIKGMGEAGLCSTEIIQSNIIGSGEFDWPIKPEGWDQEFPGINIYSSEGNDIVTASDTGTVILTTPGSILVDHGNDYQTIYSRLGEIMVSCGEEVQKGQAIGKTEASSAGDIQSFLYFEVFQAGIPINPLQVLPDFK